ncbi:MAG: beta strand repeat-containing protein [Candidatus Spyradosoma sp.]
MNTRKLFLSSLLAAATMSVPAYADFIWNGGETITQDLWQTEASWALTGTTTWPTGGNGPLTPNSNAWNGVTVANASGTVDTFEGWALGLTLQNANLTVTTLNKLQGGCTLNLDAGSVLTVSQYSSAGNDGGSTTLNVEGVFNLVYNKNQGGEGFVANLGNGGVLNFTAYNATARTAKVSQLNATLNTWNFDSYTIDTNGNTVYTRNLITLGSNVSFDSTTTAVTMTAGAGVGTLTAVEDISDADAGSYKVTKDSSGYSVSYVVAGTTYAWNATAADSVWDTSAENWTTDGGSTSVAFTDGGNVYFSAGESLTKTVAINSAVTAGTISVKDDYTFNVGSSGSLSATTIAVDSGKTMTLDLAANMSLGANLVLPGTLKKTGTGLLTYTGTIASSATLEIASAGTASESNVFSGTLSEGGNLIVSNGSYVVFDIPSNNATQTVKKFSGNVTVDGAGSVLLIKDSTATSNVSDQLNYYATNTLTVSNGGTIDFGTTRQTINANNRLVLAGGTIAGTNGNSTAGGDGYGAVDFNANNTVRATTADSEISANVRFRTGNTVSFDVDENVTLTLSGKINPKESETLTGSLAKTGAGTLKLSGDNSGYHGATTVSGGKLVAAHANALGSGAVTVSGDGSILDINLSGTLTASQALTTTGAGKITVSAGTLELAGAVNLSNAIEVASGAAVTTTDDVRFALGGLTGADNEDGTTTFTLFTLETGASLTWDSLAVENLNFANSSVVARAATATFDNAAGTVTVSGTAGDLVWNGGNAGTWNYTATNWTLDAASVAFQNKDNVTFSTSGEVSVTVDSAGVRAGTVTISSGTVTFSGGTVTADDSVVIGNGATLKLSPVSTSEDNGSYVVGEVEVQSGGTLDMNGVGGASFGGLTTVTLAGGKLTNTSTSKGTNARQFDSIVLTADSSVVAESNHNFGLVKSGHAATTLNLGTNTLTKSGAGAFLLVNTTISGNGGVLDVAEGTILGLTNDGKNIALGEGVTLKTSGSGGAQDVKITSMDANSKLILGGSTASTVALSGALGAGAVIDVSGANAVTGTITSIGANSSLTLAGTGASTVTWRHDGANETTNASIFIGSESTFKDVSIYKYHLELSGTLSGAGTLISAVADNGAGQNDGWRYITLSGSTAGFTGEWQLESANGTAGTVGGTDWSEHNRHVLGILDSSDGVFGGVVNFTSTGAAAAKVSSKLVLLKDMEIGGLKGSLANTSVVGASSVSDDTNGTITTANRALTINVADGKSYDYAGKIDSTVSLKKTGSGTQILSGDNSAYTGTTRIEGGMLVAASANALGGASASVTVAADAKLGLVAGTTVTVSGGVELASGAKLVVDLSDRASATETFTLDLVSGTALRYSETDISSTNVESLLGALELSGWNQSGWTQSLAYIDDSRTLQLTMTIPEPSVFGLLAGLGALALAGTRRRRRKA